MGCTNLLDQILYNQSVAWNRDYVKFTQAKYTIKGMIRIQIRTQIVDMYLVTAVFSR
jgi:hypothetical protein